MMAALSLREFYLQEMWFCWKTRCWGERSGHGERPVQFLKPGCSWKDYGGKDLPWRHAFEHLSPVQTVELFEELGVLAEKRAKAGSIPILSRPRL